MDSRSLKLEPFGTHAITRKKDGERDREASLGKMITLNVVVAQHHHPLLLSCPSLPYKFKPFSSSFSIISSPFSHSLSKYHSPNLSQMPSQTAKPIFYSSARRCAWMQDTSPYCDTFFGHRTKLGQLHSVFPTSPAIVSSVQDLFDFICSGPLMKKLGLTPEMVEATIDRWLECGVQLCRLFQLNELNLTIPQKTRLFHYYIPVFFWCEDQILDHRSKFEDGDEIPPLVIGVSAPQGSGKTTLVFALDYLFRLTGRNSATLSIDDLYLTAEDQAKLRNENAGNSLLELRGNAGSHDLQFSIDTLTGLLKLTKEGMKMKVPRYDKSAYGGKGDRADPSTWPEVEGPLTVLLFEGWMLGFKPLPDEVVKEVDPQLEVVNRHLKAYYDAWDKFIQSWLVIKIKEPNCVFQWRLQAEIAMRSDGKTGMSDEEVIDFVSRYLPAYKAYLPTLYAEGPSGSDPEHVLVVEIDEDRNPMA
ncbi:D-glycerate 3-kinase, chloroplastic-like [Tasmannia lanceolata]|uniref:D-glycerate 3-kinase, chloroplastic-like n=1 Tax=Tasmannia lanceolata TaxID=3420 RepID=UPI004062C194